jgi:hypothetical protein
MAVTEVHTNVFWSVMRRMDQESSPAIGPPKTPGDPSGEVYQPPQVMWEEEFAPLAADSVCDPQTGCGDGFRIPPGGS